MTKTLFIHIGHFKTGTTALQTFCARNHRFLAKYRLHYAQSHRNLAKHSALAFSLYKAAGVKTLMHGYKRAQTPQELWGDVFDELRGMRRGNLLVSSEEFMRLGQFPEALALFKDIVSSAEDIDIRIIAYLRPPGSQLRSWYNQLIKMGVKTPPFEAAIGTTIEPIHYDYSLAIQPWIELFGAEAVILRNYGDALRVDEALYQDFLSIFDIDLPSKGVDFGLRDPNPRLDDRLIEVVRVMQNAELPKDLVKWTLSRSLDYLEKAEGEETPVDFARLQHQIEASISHLPSDALDLEALKRAPAAPEGADTDAGWRMVGLLLNELHVLRRRTQRDKAELEARLETLETLLKVSDAAPK